MAKSARDLYNEMVRVIDKAAADHNIFDVPKAAEAAPALGRGRSIRPAFLTVSARARRRCSNPRPHPEGSRRLRLEGSEFTQPEWKQSRSQRLGFMVALVEGPPP